jgi:hypothetical protein
MGGDLGHGQAPGCSGLVQGPVDPGQVGPARPAEQARVPGRHRQVEHDRAIGDRREQGAQVVEQLARPGVQDVIDPDPARHHVRPGGQPGKLDVQHVPDERAGHGQVQHPPGQAGLLAQHVEDLADVPALRAGGAESLCGRVAEDHPQWAFRLQDLLVVRLPVVREGRAVGAHRGDAIGPPPERPGAQPGDLGGMRAGQVGPHGGHDLHRRAPTALPRAA